MLHSRAISLGGRLLVQSGGVHFNQSDVPQRQTLLRLFLVSTFKGLTVAVDQALAENLENKATQVGDVSRRFGANPPSHRPVLVPGLPLPHVPCHFPQSHQGPVGVVQPARKLESRPSTGHPRPWRSGPPGGGTAGAEGLKRALRIRCFFRSNLSDFTGDLQGLSVSTKHHLNRAQG